MDKVLAVVTYRDETVLIHRVNEPAVWSPPGGFVKDSSPQQQALEEIYEETEIEKEYIESCEHIDEYKDLDVFHCKLSSKPPLAMNCSEWDMIGWFDLYDLPKTSPPPQHRIWKRVI